MGRFIVGFGGALCLIMSDDRAHAAAVAGEASEAAQRLNAAPLDGVRRDLRFGSVCSLKALAILCCPRLTHSQSMAQARWPLGTCPRNP